MVMYSKSACNLDVLARADDFLPRARLLIVWKACKARQEIEVKHTAQRAVETLPPQTTDQDFGLAKESLEAVEKISILDYETPSTVLGAENWRGGDGLSGGAIDQRHEQNPGGGDEAEGGAVPESGGEDRRQDS